MDPIFEVHLLNDAGKTKAIKIAEAFEHLLSTLMVEECDANGGREFAIVKTKLEEACFFAKKAMATKGRNQQTPGAKGTTTGRGQAAST